jgi:hypothetical protein
LPPDEWGPFIVGNVGNSIPVRAGGGDACQSVMSRFKCIFSILLLTTHHRPKVTETHHTVTEFWAELLGAAYHVFIIIVLLNLMVSLLVNSAQTVIVCNAHAILSLR